MSVKPICDNLVTIDLPIFIVLSLCVIVHLIGNSFKCTTTETCNREGNKPKFSFLLEICTDGQTEQTVIFVYRIYTIKGAIMSLIGKGNPITLSLISVKVNSSTIFSHAICNNHEHRIAEYKIFFFLFFHNCLFFGRTKVRFSCDTTKKYFKNFTPIFIIYKAKKFGSLTLFAILSNISTPQTGEHWSVKKFYTSTKLILVVWN